MQHRARIISLFIALYLSSCHGPSGVHEAPPAGYPDTEIERPPPRAGLPALEPAPAEPAPADSAEPWPSAGDVLPSFEASEVGQHATAPEREARSDLAPTRAAPAATRLRGVPSRGALTQPAKRAATERPGLATHWGETRYSPARSVDFERADGALPLGTLQLHYDDQRGALQLLPGATRGSAELRGLSGTLRLRMLDATGRAFPALRRDGRVVAIGEPGERYSLLIENQGSGRFEVVVTVDGLDVLDGGHGDLEKRGYLLAAHSSVLVDGFRRSAAEVAAFRLGDVGGSYAASKGKARNVGVIGCALFAERPPQQHDAVPPVSDGWLSDETLRRRAADPFPARHAHPPGG